MSVTSMLRPGRWRRRSAAAVVGTLVAISGGAGSSAPAEEPLRIHRFTLDAQAWTAQSSAGTLAGASKVSIRLDDIGTVVRSTPFEPGLAGAAGSLLSTLAGAPDGVLPAYPFYADASAPPDQSAEVGGQAPGAPGAEAHSFSGRSTARLNFGHGIATAKDASLAGPAEPVGMGMGSGRAEAQGAAVGESLAGASVADVRDLSLLGGTLTVDSVFVGVEVKWDDPSGRPSVVPVRRIEGVRFLGRPATITEDGLFVDGQSVSPPNGPPVRAGTITSDGSRTTVEGVVVGQGASRVIVGVATYLYASRLDDELVDDDGDDVVEDETGSPTEAVEVTVTPPTGAPEAIPRVEFNVRESPVRTTRAAVPVRPVRHSFWLLTMVVLVGSIAWLGVLGRPLLQRVRA